MLGFFLFALAFVGLLTLVVRLTGLGVRQSIPRRDELLISAIFIALVLGAWWLLTRGDRFARHKLMCRQLNNQTRANPKALAVCLVGARHHGKVGTRQ